MYFSSRLKKYPNIFRFCDGFLNEKGIHQLLKQPIHGHVLAYNVSHLVYAHPFLFHAIAFANSYAIVVEGVFLYEPERRFASELQPNLAVQVSCRW